MDASTGRVGRQPRHVAEEHPRRGRVAHRREEAEVGHGVGLGECAELGPPAAPLGVEGGEARRGRVGAAEHAVEDVVQPHRAERHDRPEHPRGREAHAGGAKAPIRRHHRVVRGGGFTDAAAAVAATTAPVGRAATAAVATSVRPVRELTPSPKGTDQHPGGAFANGTRVEGGVPPRHPLGRHHLVAVGRPAVGGAPTVLGLVVGR